MGCNCGKKKTRAIMEMEIDDDCFDQKLFRRFIATVTAFLCVMDVVCFVLWLLTLLGGYG